PSVRSNGKAHQWTRARYADTHLHRSNFRRHEMTPRPDPNQAPELAVPTRGKLISRAQVLNDLSLRAARIMRQHGRPCGLEVGGRHDPTHSPRQEHYRLQELLQPEA